MIQHQEVIKCVLVREALYNLDHPLEYVPKSIEVQRACMKEREFYVAFLERLAGCRKKLLI